MITLEELRVGDRAVLKGSNIKYILYEDENLDKFLVSPKKSINISKNTGTLNDIVQVVRGDKIVYSDNLKVLTSEEKIWLALFFSGVATATDKTIVTKYQDKNGEDDYIVLANVYSSKDGYETISLPYFETGTKFANMAYGQSYSLHELGIDVC